MAYQGWHRPKRTPWWRLALEAARRRFRRFRAGHWLRTGPAGRPGRHGATRPPRQAAGRARVTGLRQRGYSGTHRTGAVTVRSNSRHASGHRARRADRGGVHQTHKSGVPVVTVLATIGRNA
jgi:hypothetical protein